MRRQTGLMGGAIVLSLFCAAVLVSAADDAPASKAFKGKGKLQLNLKKGQETDGGTYLTFIGTYTGGDSKGIYVSRFDSKTGKLSVPELAAEVGNPSFLAIHPNHKFLYSVTEGDEFEGRKTGTVSAFSVDGKTGQLTFLNKQASEGAGPCHLVVDAAGKNVLVANYSGGSIACLPIGDDGTLGKATSAVQHEGSSVNPNRQEGPHAHSINLDPANHYAFAADLGLDKVLVYRFDAEKGSLTPNDPPSASVEPGSGPRHFAFHPNGRNAYVINEMANTVTAFAYDDSKGTLAPLQTISTLPEGFKEVSYTAEVVVHPSGKFLYGSNRGHDSIAVFRIDDQTGQLEFAEAEPTGGKTPRNFFISPDGRFLLAENQDSGSVVVFQIHAKTGELSPAGDEIAVPNPCCIRMMPAGE